MSNQKIVYITGCLGFIGSYVRVQIVKVQIGGDLQEKIEDALTEIQK